MKGEENMDIRDPGNEELLKKVEETIFQKPATDDSKWAIVLDMEMAIIGESKYWANATDLKMHENGSLSFKTHNGKRTLINGTYTAREQ